MTTWDYPVQIMAHQFPQDRSDYFDIPTSKNTHSGSSTPISPGTIPTGPTKATSPTPRSLLKILGRRTRSDYDSVHRRVHVQAIEEDVPVRPDLTNTSVLTSISHGSADHPDVKELVENSAASIPITSTTPTSYRSHRYSSQHSDDSQALRKSENHAYPPRRPRIGHMWARTQSGSVWFETQKLPPITSTSIPPVFPVDYSSPIPIRLEQFPLVPPTQHRISQSIVSGSSKVKVETPFTESNRETPIKERELVRETTVNSRRNSFDPRRIFSAPLSLLRRLSLPRRQSRLKPSLSLSSASRTSSNDGPRLADHSTLLKRNHTSEALHHVTKALQDSKNRGPNSILAGMSKPTRSRAATMISRPRLDIPTIEGIVSPIAMMESKSTDAVSIKSYTSSQRIMRMGVQPTNTPEERATYKIKRSPSTETEEYLKVDISVRGGTSYLPSEARRIHTPPLPDTTQEGKLRGFFFDYNAPRSQESLGNVDCANGHKNKRCVHRGDWYDAKLAELDASDEIMTESKSSEIEKGKKGEKGEEFDYTIPEHSPSSPLCPRNPRYWRVVKGKGSQYRGCWMHGIGEYNIVPGVRY